MFTQSLNKALSLGLSLVLTFMAVLAAPVSAQNPKAWTTVASAGTVDDDDLEQVSLGASGLAQLNTGATSYAQAILRYNVVATDGLFVTGYPRMQARFMDSGAQAQVLISLYRVNLDTGAVTKVLELDSNDYAGANAFQTQTTSQCAGSNFGFDFTNYAFYIEAKLTRTSNNGLAKLMSIQLFNHAGNTCH